MSKLETYQKLIDAYVATGMDRFSAGCRVRREYPALAGDVVGEANAGAPPDPGTPTGEAAVVEWRRRFQALLARGMSRRDAIAKLGREEPGLRQAYVEAVNGQAPPRRRAGERDRSA